MLADGAGNVIKTYTYDAFGVETNKDEADTNPFRYAGEYYDGEMDSIYLRARYYAPRTGRFTTEDPIRDGLNWYSYCYNNPVMLVDPWGLSGEGLTLQDRLLFLQANPEKEEELWQGDLEQYDKDLSDATEQWIENEGRGKATTLKEYDDKYIIFAYIQIYGEGADEQIGNTTYRQLAARGIKDSWSASNIYNDKDGYVIIRDLSNQINPQNIHPLIRINIKNEMGVSNAHFFGDITMYIGDIRNGTVYSENEFAFVTGHEFGHSLGVKDVYEDIKPFNNIACFMNNPFLTQGKIYPIDYAMMVKAQQTRAKQSCSGNLDILKKFGYI